MDEQRKYERRAVDGVHRDAACATKSLWAKTLRPLLYLVGSAPFSKGVSKGLSKERLTTRSGRVGIALLNGYSIGSTWWLPGLGMTIAKGTTG